MRNHRGFTLIELMIALVIMVTVTGGIYKLLNGTQRLSRAQAERVDLQSNVRTAALLIPSELRELNAVTGSILAAQNDILTAGATNIRYRAMRGIGFVCQASALQIRLKASTYSGTRAPQPPPRDAAYVFVQGISSASDAWLPVTYTGLAASTCPDGTAAYALTVPSMTPPPNGTPVRIYEIMELSVYVVDGKPWLGAQSISAGELTPQPILGPLRATNGTVTGLQFQYFDGTGTVTAVPANIKSVRVSVWGETSQRIAKSGGGTASNGFMQDSLVTQVSLRNSFRP